MQNFLSRIHCSNNKWPFSEGPYGSLLSTSEKSNNLRKWRLIYEKFWYKLKEQEHNRCCLRVSLSKKILKVILCNIFSVYASIFLTKFKTCFWKKAQKFLIVHNWIFPFTALNCPYGQKVKIHVGNWSEAPSVLSTLFMSKSLIHIQ